jgi:hypothetical protein
MPINLNDFTPLSAVFEVRYAPAFRIWDRSGALWNRIADTFPAISTKQAQPNQVLVRLAPNIDAAVGVEQSVISALKPDSSLDRLKAAAGAVLPAMIDLFEIDQFTRIGLRLMFVKRFPERDGAVEFLANCVPIPQPRGKIMNVDGRLLDPQIAFRWESQTTGFQLRLLANQQQLNMELPAEYQHIMPAAKDLILNQALIDIDYYVHSQVSADQFRADELIDNWLRAIKRDIGKVLND